MYTLFVILTVIVAILLALVVLIQESKGGGLASNVSGANSVLGVRKTTDVVEKTTWILSALLVVFAVSTSFFDNDAANDPTQTVTNMTDPAPVAPKNVAIPGAAQPAGGVQPAPTQNK